MSKELCAVDEREELHIWSVEFFRVFLEFMLILHEKYFMISVFFFISVHPCDRENNGGCDQICIKAKKKSKCGCREGFHLLPDQLTCDKSKYFGSFPLPL